MRPRLSAFEKAWTDAAADAIFPERGRLPHGIVRMGPARFLGEVLVQVPLEQALGIRITLWVIALAPLFTIGRVGTIASISETDRVRVLERLVSSRIYVLRQLAMSFKAVVTLLYVQSEAVRRAMSVSPGHVEAVADDRLISGTRLVAKAAVKRSGAEGADHVAA